MIKQKRKDISKHFRQVDECRSKISSEEMKTLEKIQEKKWSEARIRKFEKSMMEDTLNFDCSSCCRLLFRSQVTEISAQEEEHVKLTKLLVHCQKMDVLIIF